jgi:hypothetical protein
LKITLKRLLFSISSVALVTIYGCGGGGGSATPGASSSTTITGVATKGPLNGSTVCAYSIIANAKGNLIGQCASNIVNGRYSIDSGAYSGPVLLEATGGTYLDEATGQTVSLTVPLHSFLDNTNGGVANVAITPLTELAYQSATSVTQGLTSTRIQDAVRTVQTSFGIADIVNTQPIDALNVPATANSEQKKYALALATISQYQSMQPAGTTLTSILRNMGGCLGSPNSGCGTGSASVGSALNAAQTAFQANHTDLAGSTLPLLTFGTPPSSLHRSLSASTASLTFDQQTPGTSSPVQVITLTNNGTVAIIDPTVSFTVPPATGNVSTVNFTQSTTCGSPLPIGATCTISVTFSPNAYTADGLSSIRTGSAAVTYSSYGTDTTTPLNLIWTGSVAAVPKPAITVSPASLTFPGQSVGVSSAPQMVTLTNTGNAPLDFTCIETPPIGGSSSCYSINTSQLGMAADYAQTNTCTYHSNLSYPPLDNYGAAIQPRANLDVGQSCTVSVKFTPTTTGIRTGGLIVDSNASNNANGGVILNGNSTAVVTASGTISGYIRDAITNLGLAGITVEIYTGSTLVATLTTNASGIYNTNLPVGTYTLVITKAGYLTENLNGASVQENVTSTIETVLQVSSSNVGTGIASGVVNDAFTGQGLSGVALSLRAGINASNGAVLANVTTTSGGFFSVSTLSSGSYTAQASLNGYTIGYFTITVVGGTSRANQNGTITPILASGQTRIVLTWGTSPSDLDSHLTGPVAGSSTRFHTYFSNKGSSTASPFAKLDVDDTSSFGPETVTIYQAATGVYRYSVYDYTNGGSTNSTALSNSGAQVKVYAGSSPVQAFTVPVNQTGTLWTVFEISSGVVSPKNTMTNVSSSGLVP